MESAIGDDKSERTTSTPSVENAGVFLCIFPQRDMQSLWMSIFLVLVGNPTSCSSKPERDNPQLVLPSEQRVKERPKTRSEPHSGRYGAEHAAHRATLQSIWIVISNDRQ